MDLPSHREAHDTDPDPEPEPATKINRAALLLFGAIGALLILIVILHLTGVVGPAAH